MMAMPRRPVAVRDAGAAHLRNPALRPGFAIGFCILFAFIGTFTYVNFVLVRAPLGLDQMALGFVYFVFLPSILTTPLAGRAVARFGAGPTLLGALGAAAAGLPLLVLPSLPAVLAGLALVAVGTFFAQAIATGFVGRAATTDRGLGERPLSRLVFLRRPRRQRRSRPGLRPAAAGPPASPAIGLSLAAAALLSLRLHVMPVRSIPPRSPPSAFDLAPQGDRHDHRTSRIPSRRTRPCSPARSPS